MNSHLEMRWISLVVGEIFMQEEVSLDRLRFVMGLWLESPWSQVRPLAVPGPRFFGGRRSALKVSCCVISMPPALERRYYGWEPLASDRDLTGLVAPSSALSCKWASEGSGLRIVAALERWWLPLRGVIIFCETFAIDGVWVICALGGGISLAFGRGVMGDRFSLQGHKH